MEILKGKIFGHPVHMILIHFPAALFPFSAGLAFFSHLLQNSELMKLEFISTCTGSVLGWVAAIFGIMELLSIKSNDKALQTALIHAGINFTVVCIFSFYGFVEFKHYPVFAYSSLAGVIVKGFAVLLLMAGNFFGGELVLKYKIGTKSI